MINALRALRVTEPGRLGPWVALAAALLFPAATAAQQPASESTAAPSLFDHAFVIPVLMRTPFVRTNVSNSVGIGQAVDIDFGSFVRPNGDTVSVLDGDLTFAALRFEYEHALRDWLSVWGQVQVAARLGTDVGSLFSAGVTVATGLELGWLAQLRETERSLLSASVFVRKAKHTLLDLPRWVDETISGNPADILFTTPSLRAGAGLGYAWALNDLIGFIFTGDTSYGEELSRVESQFYFSGSVAMSLNMYPRTNVPLGVALTFRADSHPSLNGEQTEGWEALELRLSYTGRDDLRLSLTSLAQRVPHQEDDAMTVGLFSFDIQYFF